VLISTAISGVTGASCQPVQTESSSLRTDSGGEISVCAARNNGTIITSNPLKEFYGVRTPPSRELPDYRPVHRPDAVRHQRDDVARRMVGAMGGVWHR